MCREKGVTPMLTFVEQPYAVAISAQFLTTIKKPANLI
jgi:hypothetical protein